MKMRLLKDGGRLVQYENDAFVEEAFPEKSLGDFHIFRISVRHEDIPPELKHGDKIFLEISSDGLILSPKWVALSHQKCLEGRSAWVSLDDFLSGGVYDTH
jgi:hypothetical protein